LRGKGKLFLWPSYFDTDFSWRKGRRVPRELASRGVSIEEVFNAASELGLSPVLNTGAVLSRRPWLKTGVVMVDKTGRKTGVLKDLAQKIRSNRAQK